MRVLIIDSNEIALLALQSELAGHYEIVATSSLAEALAAATRPGGQPDVVVLGLDLLDLDRAGALEALQRAVSDAPVIVGTDSAAEALRRRIDRVTGAAGPLGEGQLLLQTVLHQHQLLQHTITSTRAEIIAQLDVVARQAAENAVSRAIGELMARLGLEDGEGMRMAVRLARAWETAKSRFFSTITTGIASALLLAIGAGVVALLRQGDAR